MSVEEEARDKLPVVQVHLEGPNGELGSKLTSLNQMSKTNNDLKLKEMFLLNDNISRPEKDQAGLLYVHNERAKTKDFESEVRALMDVEQFVHEAELLLDLEETSIEGILDLMLMKVLSGHKDDASRLKEAKQVLLVQGSSSLLAKSIQGVQSGVEIEDSRKIDTLKFDETWLCALCQLASVKRRHTVMATLKCPIDFGPTARDTRLIALIVTPIEEKGTKTAYEVGRTFATMLNDPHLVNNLLATRDPNEFKALIMLKAQELSGVSLLDNRHKYMFNPAVVHIATSRSSGVSFNDKQSPNAISGKFYGSPDRDGLFKRHPRASKLLELIMPGNETKSDSNDPFGVHERVPTFTSSERTDEEESTSGCCGLWSVCKQIEFGTGIAEDISRRLRYYVSDFTDAFVGPPRTAQKTLATTWFLYFGILLPTIAFSSLNTIQTGGHMGDLRKALIGQAIGGLGFAFLAGQPLVIIMTTAPLCLYTKVIYRMCQDYGFDFTAIYAAVGLWNAFFLIIYSLFGFSKLMKWCTRSTEEIFALFIVVAFLTDAKRELTKNFKRFYYTSACQGIVSVLDPVKDALSANKTSLVEPSMEEVMEAPICRRETSLLFVLLMLGTLWLAIYLNRFNRQPYLSMGIRTFFSDYALPIAVIIMSFFGSVIFNEIYVDHFPPVKDFEFDRAKIETLSVSGVLVSGCLGFTLSLLFFMDQNISAAMVTAPQNKLKKGSAFHLDIFVVALLNVFLTMFGFPMMHGVLPHSPLHARSLADIEERVIEGHCQQVVVHGRETRVTAIASHILIAISLLFIPHPIAYIPTAVLNGLFLYMAVTSLDGLQIFERILLIFTEQKKYPPNHYVRRCPQKAIHQFTIIQLLQLLVMCLFGFSPFNTVEMFFPVLILLMIPFRHKIVPKFVDKKYLENLDSTHH